tara:strand:+ start:1013 stop:1528 length:516 start_codon:yes stop_codon:yes gene_type:complete
MNKNNPNESTLTSQANRKVLRLMSIKKTLTAFITRHKIKKMVRSFKTIEEQSRKTIPVRSDLDNKPSESEMPLPYQVNWKGVAAYAWLALEEDNVEQLERYLSTYAPYFTYGEGPTDDRKECIEDEHLEYLDELHSVAMVNMWGAGTHLREEFKLTKKETRAIMVYWMKNK